MKQFHKEWWQWHLEGGCRKCPSTHSRAQVAQAGRVCFYFSLLSPALSASPHISQHWGREQSRREGNCWFCSEPAGPQGALSQPPAAPVTLQRGTTLLPGTARTCCSFHVSCQSRLLAAGGCSALPCQTNLHQIYPPFSPCRGVLTAAFGVGFAAQKQPRTHIQVFQCFSSFCSLWLHSSLISWAVFSPH